MWDFDGGLVVKIGGLPSNAEDLGLTPDRETKLSHEEKQLNLCAAN